MDSIIDGVRSLPPSHNSATMSTFNPRSRSRPPHPRSAKQSNREISPSSSHFLPDISTMSVASSYKTSKDYIEREAIPSTHSKPNSAPDKRKTDVQSARDYFHNHILEVEAKFGSKQPINPPIGMNTDRGHGHGHGPGPGHVPSASPQNSFYSVTQFSEAKESFTSTEVSEFASTIGKDDESGQISVQTSDYLESNKTSSIYRESTGSDLSDDSTSSSFNSAIFKPHKQNDTRWEAIQIVRSRNETGMIEIRNFRHLKRLGCGDIGSVYLSELIGTQNYFAMKVMDKTALASRNKLLRAQTEKEILQSLDHPFLPTLYAHFDTEKLSCLVMEYCPGGDLHALRQKQPGKFFPEHAVRFYVAEVLLALEYLHMLGIIYRDLKPENVLVREDGHIMLSDFDLSLRCVVNPKLVRSMRTTTTAVEPKTSDSRDQPACIEPSCMVQPSCMQPSCFSPRFMSKPKKEKRSKPKTEIYNQAIPLPELIAEPTNARSMSFVGTHEYLAPEIIKGEGHGSAVDWWTFGIFLYELLFGKTPFKGASNRATLFNVVGHPLRFPETPSVSFAARDLIRGLLVKEPQHRLAYRRGATEIKQHPFFQSVNWALIRCATPPDIPIPSPERVEVKPTGSYLEIDFF
ncbi:unnamed protein product [Lactuca saligna]|uniref:non-specific serine/threonine protein kinase n=1 Tax=Lactuca saligna TaxID=75948 RepID=A0AA35YF31_LACSI|nr:unnamed protein product [Lactuca saligna]